MRLTSLGRLYVRTLVLLDGREAPAVLEREPHHGDDVSRLDGREGLALELTAKDCKTSPPTNCAGAFN